MKKHNIAKLRLLRTIWLLLAFSGVGLLVYMIKIEGEPGALPIFTLLCGIAGFIYTQLKIKNATV